MAKSKRNPHPPGWQEVVDLFDEQKRLSDDHDTVVVINRSERHRELQREGWTTARVASGRALLIRPLTKAAGKKNPLKRRGDSFQSYYDEKSRREWEARGYQTRIISEKEYLARDWPSAGWVTIGLGGSAENKTRLIARSKKNPKARDPYEKALRKKSRRKNPDAYVIACYTGERGNKRLTYDATRNRFTDNSKPSLYRTQIAARSRASGLLKAHPNLFAYRIQVEPADAKERGSVFGARPRRNPHRKK